MSEDLKGSFKSNDEQKLITFHKDKKTNVVLFIQCKFCSRQYFIGNLLNIKSFNLDNRDRKKISIKKSRKKLLLVKS